MCVLTLKTDVNKEKLSGGIKRNGRRGEERKDNCIRGRDRHNIWYIDV